MTREPSELNRGPAEPAAAKAESYARVSAQWARAQVQWAHRTPMDPKHPAKPERRPPAPGALPFRQRIPLRHAAELRRLGVWTVISALPLMALTATAGRPAMMATGLATVGGVIALYVVASLSRGAAATRRMVAAGKATEIRLEPHDGSVLWQVAGRCRLGHKRRPAIAATIVALAASGLATMIGAGILLTGGAQRPARTLLAGGCVVLVGSTFGKPWTWSVTGSGSAGTAWRS